MSSVHKGNHSKIKVMNFVAIVYTQSCSKTLISKPYLPSSKQALQLVRCLMQKHIQWAKKKPTRSFKSHFRLTQIKRFKNSFKEKKPHTRRISLWNKKQISVLSEVIVWLFRKCGKVEGFFESVYFITLKTYYFCWCKQMLSYYFDLWEGATSLTSDVYNADVI